ncbi:MAG: hypothetical protein OQK35_06720 [Alphaproteobacteria bacterium]|nr:hypothetical protein [Rhodospirillales bacterium]MCW9046012.1 hypothetical protein [Alphaproteobacteria bacterium]
MSIIYHHRIDALAPSISSVPPVLRGYEALGIEESDLARMIDLPEEQLNEWRSGSEDVPDSWNVFLTNVLERLVEGLEGGSGSSPEGARMARNWLQLAQENLKDLPRQAFDGARRLAYAR